MITWVTSEMANEAMEESLQAAIDMSAKKWWNYEHCTQVELNKGLAQRQGKELDFQPCALCVYDKSGCKDCPLCKDQGLDCDEKSSLYHQARMLLYFDYNHTKANFAKFQVKAKELWRIIKNLKEKE